MEGLLIGLLVIGLAVAFVTRHRAPAARARALRLAGFWLMATAMVFFGLFAVGETFADPGGWRAAGLVALWAAPLAVLCGLAWWWPDRATRVLAVLTVVLVAGHVWFAVAPGPWREFENAHGPVRDIAVGVVAGAVALLGLRRTRIAGVLLLVIGAAPYVVASFRFEGFSSLALVSAAPVVTGLLYLFAAALGPAARSTPGTGEGPRSARHERR